MESPYDALMAAMREDLARAPTDYQPTHYWRRCSEKLFADLERHGPSGFRRRASCLQHFVPTYLPADWAAEPGRAAAGAARLAGAFPDDPRARLEVAAFASGEAQALADYRVYLASQRDTPPHTLHVSESDVGDPVGQYTFDGRRYSRSMLNYLLGLAFAKQQLGSLPVGTVLEIGGGFGTLGEILLKAEPGGTLYLDVDIPPTAVFSSYYLQQVFGADRVVDYLATRDRSAISIEGLRSEGSAAVLCAWQLPRLEGRIDLFVNFISFQEMEPAVVENYLRQIDRLEATHVLLRNLREGKQLASETSPLGVQTPVEASDYDRFLPGYELVASNVLPFGHRTADGFHSELRLYGRRR